jgi:hypothetical protein
MNRLVAVILWILAWVFSGLAVAAFFAARDGKRDEAIAMFTGGAAGAAILIFFGVLAW